MPTVHTLCRPWPAEPSWGHCRQHGNALVALRCCFVSPPPSPSCKVELRLSRTPLRAVVHVSSLPACLYAANLACEAARLPTRGATPRCQTRLQRRLSAPSPATPIQDKWRPERPAGTNKAGLAASFGGMIPRPSHVVSAGSSRIVLRRAGAGGLDEPCLFVPSLSRASRSARLLPIGACLLTSLSPSQPCVRDGARASRRPHHALRIPTRSPGALHSETDRPRSTSPCRRAVALAALLLAGKTCSLVPSAVVEVRRPPTASRAQRSRAWEC